MVHFTYNFIMRMVSSKLLNKWMPNLKTHNDGPTHVHSHMMTVLGCNVIVMNLKSIQLILFTSVLVTLHPVSVPTHQKSCSGSCFTWRISTAGTNENCLSLFVCYIYLFVCLFARLLGCCDVCLGDCLFVHLPNKRTSQGYITVKLATANHSHNGVKSTVWFWIVQIS